MDNMDFKECPFCKGKTKPQAVKCRHCKAEISSHSNFTSKSTGIAKPTRRLLLKARLPFIIVAMLLISVGAYYGIVNYLNPMNRIEKKLESISENVVAVPSNKISVISDLGSENTGLAVSLGQAFDQTYEIMIEQPLDHSQSEGETFLQKIYLSVVDVNAPVVVVIEGYDAAPKISEIALMLGCNQVIIEHRYHGYSKPKYDDWEYLNAYQAASDVNRVIELLKPLFRDKWISTGFSKGGAAAIYHSYYYPEDVVGRVLYGPSIKGFKDDSIYSFLENVGTEECRSKIYEFQKLLLDRKEDLLPENLLPLYSYDRVGSPETAYELAVLRFDFLFWQRGEAPCDDIPLQGSNEEIYDYFNKVTRFGRGFASDNDIEDNMSTYYQVVIELGSYQLPVYRFGGLLDNLKDPYLYHYYLYYHEQVLWEFDYTQHHDVMNYIANESSNYLYIVGEYDPWVTSILEISGGNPDTNILDKEAGSHQTHIFTLGQGKQKKAFQTLAKWLNYDLDIITYNVLNVDEVLFSGNNRHSYRNGSYTGGWKDGMHHGQGTLTFTSGNSYVGEFKNHKYHGQGTMTWADGGKYAGNWKDDMRHGHGTMTWPSGAKYVGGWKEDMFHGRGTMIWAEGDKYEGDWKDGMRHGYGTHSWASGKKYVGNWKEGLFHGQGTWTHPDGDKYEGEHENGMRHGQGTYTKPDGSIWSGEWDNDELVGP